MDVVSPPQCARCEQKCTDHEQQARGAGIMPQRLVVSIPCPKREGLHSGGSAEQERHGELLEDCDEAQEESDRDARCQGGSDDLSGASSR